MVCHFVHLLSNDCWCFVINVFDYFYGKQRDKAQYDYDSLLVEILLNMPFLILFCFKCTVNSGTMRVACFSFIPSRNFILALSSVGYTGFGLAWSDHVNEKYREKLSPLKKGVLFRCVMPYPGEKKDVINLGLTYVLLLILLVFFYPHHPHY